MNIRHDAYGHPMFDRGCGGIDDEPMDLTQLPDWLEPVALDRNGNSDESKELKKE